MTSFFFLLITNTNTMTTTTKDYNNGEEENLKHMGQGHGSVAAYRPFSE